MCNATPRNGRRVEAMLGKTGRNELAKQFALAYFQKIDTLNGVIKNCPDGNERNESSHRAGTIQGCPRSRRSAAGARSHRPRDFAAVANRRVDLERRAGGESQAERARLLAAR